MSNRSKEDRTGFGAFSPQAVANRVLGVFRDQLLQVGLGNLMLLVGRAGPAKDGCKFRPGIGGTHIDDSNRFQAGVGGLDPKSRGTSPFTTQRQNFFSAVTRRCWYSGSAWMGISTHLPPPVITDSTADLELATHILCCSCAMCFAAASSSLNDHGSMNLASNTAAVCSTRPSRVAAIHLLRGMLDAPLNVLDGLTGIALEPAPVKRFGDGA